MKNYLIVISLLMLLVNTSKTQAQWGNQWVLGNESGLSFNTSNLPNIWPNALTGSCGNSIMCDDSGQAILYTDGDICFNKLHQQMPNGYDLGAQNTCQTQSIILPHPDGSNRYFIFAIDECYDLADTTFCSGLGNYGGLIWAMADMNLEAGLGDVVIKQQHLYYPACSKVTATRHCNGVDWWVVTKEYNTNRFFTYLITSAGINPVPVITNIGLKHPINFPNDWGINAKKGQMKISSDGKLLAIKSFQPCFTQLFRFNNQTGIIYDQIFSDFHDTLNPNTPGNLFNHGIGLSFSPDNTKLYVNYGSYELNLIQYDLSVLDSLFILNSKINILENSPVFWWRSGETMDYGPDGKLYIIIQDTLYNIHLSYINYPNKLGMACSPSFQFIPHMVDSLNDDYLTTPNFAECIYARHHSGALLIPNCTGSIDSLSFTDTLMNVVHDFYWDFGDPASGANNTSTEHFPIHNFTSPGTYTVTLTVQNDCDGYTVTQQVNIGSNVPNVPTINVNGISLQSSNASTYQWYFNNNVIAGATNQLYTPLQSGYYSVLVTDSNGCMVQSIEFYFAVTALKPQQHKGEMMVVPNPASQSINILSSEIFSLIIIMDMAGRKVLQTNTTRDIDISELQNGIYFISATNGNKELQTKLVINK